ncbi:MAG: hypothetical protein LBI17_01790, partial [Rickettsiales bacterium]|nr:hypothetical protein [Rickettsiales bacterium]
MRGARTTFAAAIMAAAFAGDGRAARPFQWPKQTQEVITSGKVTVFPIAKKDLDKYGYREHEYWMSGTDVVNEFSIEDASRFYGALFGAIRDNFVREVAFGEMADKILESMSAFMDKLDITVTGERIFVYDGNMKLIGNFKKPSESDSTSWANLVVNVILNLRDNVPEIREAHPEQIYYMNATYLLKSLDANAYYLDPAGVERERAGHHSTSLGFTWRRIPFGLQVLSIAKDSPIYFSDIREGDVITHVNTAAAKDISDELVEDALFGNDFGMVHFNYVGYMTRQEGEAFIRRNASASPSATLAVSRPEAPIIVIHNFRAGSARALKALIDGLGAASSAKGLIIDVRGNTGGELIEAIEAANLFADGGELLKTKGRGEGTSQLFTAKAGDILSGKPVAIIADMTTRGPAEAFVLAMTARRRAVAAGSPTFGSGTAASRFELPGGRAASFATKAVFAPNGQALDGIGALPLVCIASFKNEKDIDAFAKNATGGKFKDERPKLEKPSDA